MLLRQWEKEKKNRTCFRVKKHKINKIALLMKSADGKGTVFPVKLELDEEQLE